jgi:hypothetical protein
MWGCDDDAPTIGMLEDSGLRQAAEKCERKSATCFKVTVQQFMEHGGGAGPVVT